MTGLNLFGSLIELLKLIWGFFIPFTIVKEYERGVRLRLGKVKKTKGGLFMFFTRPWKWFKNDKVEEGVIGPGFIVHAPFYVDEVMTANVAFETGDIEDLQLYTKDLESIDIKAVVGYRITNVRKFLIDVEDATDALVDACGGAIFDAVRGSSWEEINSPEFVERVHQVVKEKAQRKFGVRIDTLYFHTLTKLGLDGGVIKVVGLPSAIIMSGPGD